MVGELPVAVTQRETNHVHTHYVPHTVDILIGGGLTACSGVVSGLVDDAVGSKLGAEISHNATLRLLVEVVVSHIDIVGESGLQIGVTDDDAERVGDIGDRLQLSHRRLRRARAVVGLQ